MTRPIALVCSLALAAAAAHAHADGHFDRTLGTGSAPDVYVVSGSGSIRIHPGAGNGVHIAAHLRAAGWGPFGGDPHDTEDRIRRIVDAPPIAQSGNDIHIGARNADDSLYHNITIDYEISVPANTALNLATGSGDIEVDNLGRYIQATSGSGSVRAHGVHGPAVLNTGSGDIELEQQAPGGGVEARSGSGSIRVHGFAGGLQLRTGSGDIEGDGDLRGTAQMQSGSGSIRLHIQRDARFDFTGDTGSGAIRIDFPGAPLTDRDDRHHVAGPINGGGPAVTARTGSGDIEIGAR